MKDNGFIKLLAAFNLFILSLMAFKYTLPQKFDLSGEYKPKEKVAEFHGGKFNSCTDPRVTYAYSPEKKEEKEVLGESTAKKRIYVDLNKQRLYAFEGNNLVYDFVVSTGKWGWTPTGTFKIWVKLRYTLMEGGSKELGTYYYLPNVPYTMFFSNNQIPRWRGFALHGTYWHNNFGSPMSHGCVNLRTEDAAKLYHWAKPELNGRQSVYATKNNSGTEVVIYGKAPSN